MNLWEFLDRRDERKALNPRPARDIRQFVGFMFLAGYYALVFAFLLKEVPAGNKELVNACLLTLGPPVGIIVGAMFRSDKREEIATDNTRAAFRAIEAAAKAGTPEHDQQT